LTGLYARCHGINDFDTPLPRQIFEKSYPMLLRQAGYRTGFVGKWGLGGELPAADYDFFTGYGGQGRYFEPGNPKHLTVRVGEQAVEFIRGCSADQPFCLAVSFKAPHVQDEGRKEPGIYAKYPYDRALEGLYANDTVPGHGVMDVKPPPEFLNHTLNRLREGPDFLPANYQETMKSLYRLISGIDTAVGRIVEALRRQGLEENTVIIYGADHGSLYGEHGFGGKWIMYEPSIRTPLIICDPRMPAHQRGTTRDQMVLNIDLPPTLLALAGLTPPIAMQGRSLLPLVNQQPTSWRGEWFYEHLFRDGPIGPDSLIAASEGIRTERWKYIRYIDRVPVYEQLFDLKNDPREENDLMGEMGTASVLAEMRGRRENWLNRFKSWQPQNRWSEPWALTRAAI
jgi:arylsulfatase A-like enzyme